MLNSFSTLLVSVYLHHSLPVEDFSSKLELLLKIIKMNRDKLILIGGDWNSNTPILLNPNHDSRPYTKGLYLIQ